VKSYLDHIGDKRSIPTTLLSTSGLSVSTGDQSTASALSNDTKAAAGQGINTLSHSLDGSSSIVNRECFSDVM